MTYSDSTHFSDQISYKIHFISSYGLQNIIYARFKYLQQFPEKKNREICEIFLTQRKGASETDVRDPEADGDLTGQRLLRWRLRIPTKGVRLSVLRENAKRLDFCPALESNYGSPACFEGTDQLSY
jgi:hypothetical protein